MRINKILWVLFFCTCLFACEKDPGFQKEETEVVFEEYEFIPGFTYVQIKCALYSNISLEKMIVEYSTDQKLSHPLSVEMKKIEDSKSGQQTNEKYTYTVQINDLLENTTYYCRLKAISGIGTEYVKNGLEFSTMNLEESAVITLDATDITLTSATLNGKIASESSSLTINNFGFYYATNSNLDNAIKKSINNLNNFSLQLTDLLINVKYYFAAYAVIEGKEYLGNIKSFITTNYSKAQVSTGDAKDISYSSATCEMQILDKGNSSLSEVGILYGTNQNLDIDKDTKVKVSTNYYSENTTYHSSLSELLPGTMYYYCAYAINSAGAAVGEVKSFITTSLGEITITTGPAKDISYHSAYLYYSLQTTGQDIREYGIIYDLYENYHGSLIYGEDHLIESRSVSTWIGQDKTYNNQYFYISDLTTGSHYVYCAFIKYIDKYGAENIEYGSILDFETSSYEVPTVTTGNATHIYTTTAQVSLTAASNGSAIIDRGFFITHDSRAEYYSEGDDIENNDIWGIWTKKSIGKSGVSTTLTNLEDGITYYYIAYAKNGEGIGYGKIKSFTTKELKMPTVYTDLGYNYSTSAQLIGNTDGGGEKGVTVGFVYSATTTDPTIGNGTKIVCSTSFSETDSNYGEFKKVISYSSSTFSKGTIYYFKAFCTNSLGTTYGDVETFEFE